MRNPIFLVLIVLAASCQGTTSTHQPVIGENFEVEFGQKITNPGENISIEFKDVLEDSRCPIGVVCVWAGNAEILIVELQQKSGQPVKRLMQHFYDLSFVQPAPGSGS